MLVSQLPVESATGHALSGGWSVREELAATTAELTSGVVLQLRALTGDKQVKRAKPFRFPRPWDRKAKPTTDPGEIRRFFERR